MQTPGKSIEPQTPMIVSRGRNTLFERLSKAEEDIVNIERPQKRVFGNFTDKFQEIDNTFQGMQDIIKSDISEKRKYFLEEEKILKEDSKNLSNLRNNIGRQLLGAAAGIAGLAQLAQGNVRGGVGGLGTAAAIFSPEILGFISSIVAGNLVKSGLLGKGGLGTKVAGASRMKNPILMSAALAASLILPGLISSNQTADRRRQLAATRSIRGRETINAPDVDRFRTILSRFDGILSNISLERKKKTSPDGSLLEQIVEGEKLKEENKDKNEPVITSNQKGGTENLALNLGGVEEIDNSQSDVKPNDSLIAMGDTKTIINNNGNNISNKGSIFNNQTLNLSNVIGDTNVDNNLEMFESNDFGGDLNLALDFLGDSKITDNISENINFVDLTTNSTPSSDKKFNALTAIPASVFVSTNPSNLDIDLIEHSDALRTWAAYA
tara:strand:- start:1607 stop:2920 length:1314 start_codon:yes stop_codon:yes gene_type:complete